MVVACSTMRTHRRNACGLDGHGRVASRTNRPAVCGFPSTTLRLSIDTLHLVSNAGLDLVQDASFDVPAGERTALVGESGSGKSLSVLAIAGLLPNGVTHVSGTIKLNGQSLTELPAAQRRAHCGRDIGIVFQEPMTALNPVHSIASQLIEARRALVGADADATWAQGALAELALPEPASLLHAWPHQLSGGMRQRVLVAMALAASPSLVLADEPTTALDPITRSVVLDRLSAAAKAGAGVLLVTHDLASVQQWADHVVVMLAGHVCESGPAAVVLRTPAHPYTRGLLACAPTMFGKGPLIELESTVDPAALAKEVAPGNVPWWPDRPDYRLIELDTEHRVAVSGEP